MAERRIHGSGAALGGAILSAAALAAGFPPLAAGAAEPRPAAIDEAVLIAAGVARAESGERQDSLAEQADRLAALPASAIIPCLGPLAEATPAGANWLRSGLERAVEAAGDALPTESLEQFVRDRTQSHRGRSLAFVWLHERDRRRAELLLDGLLDDPAADLRHEAVERLLASADEADETARMEAYRRALSAARDVGQIERVVTWLTEHGQPVDLATVLGFVRRWRVSEAFDNRGGQGFARAYPPEAGEGTRPETTGWKDVVSRDRHGAVDLNAAIETKKGVLAYAEAVVSMPRAGQAEVRIGSPCAVAVWVNGRSVMAHEIYHASEAVDQYVALADFQAGENVVLVKCCQNEQTEPWAVDWKFQLRICDAGGRPLATQPQP